MIKLSIIIVTWNSEEYIKNCLDAVSSSKTDFEYEIIVIDNNSSDSTSKIVASSEYQDKLHFIQNSSNLGFATANNQGIKIAKGEFILLLNPDTRVTENAISELVNCFSTNKEIGIVGGKLLNEDGSFQKGTARRFPKLFDFWIILSGLARFAEKKSKRFRDYMMLADDFSNEMEVDQIMGANLVFKKSILRKVEVLDEKFLLWFEEVDFCKRAKDAGYKIVYTPKSVITHIQGPSFAKTPKLKKFFILSHSIFRYSWKHLPKSTLLLLSLAWILGLLVSTFVAIFKIPNEKS